MIDKVESSKQEKLLRKTARFVWYPLAWVFVVVYMTFETLWSAVSDWVFTYTPLRVFSERIHHFLEGRSKWLVLLVYLIHFITMQGMAVVSGQMFLHGKILLGLTFYVGKGLVTIPTVRFFILEKDKLLLFWPIRIGYQVVTFIKSSRPYGRVAEWAIGIKVRIKAFSTNLLSKNRR